MIQVIYRSLEVLIELHQGSYRGVAQLGSAPAWGAGGRRFKSCRPDQLNPYGVGLPEIFKISKNRVGKKLVTLNALNRLLSLI